MRLKEQLRDTIRERVGDRERMLLSRLSFAVGLRPRVNRSAAHTLAYPGDRRAAIVVSADLELAWAWRFARAETDPLDVARRRARQGRRNLRVVLDLCDRYELPVTWATVGHLFLNGCDRLNGRVHPELPRVPYFTNQLWTYQSGDWFEHDPGAQDPTQPDWADWYGPDLIRSILARRVKHEIGCHTFSHMIFSDQHCPPEVAEAELHRCQELAAEWGLRLRSFVFSGNLEGNLPALRAAGFSAYRSEDWYDLDVPRRDPLGLWRIPGGVCLDRPYAQGRVADHVRLLRRCVDVALEQGLVCSFWFHPETDPRDVDEVFPAIFEYIAAHRSDLWVTTMSEMTDWLETAPARAPGSASNGRLAQAPPPTTPPPPRASASLTSAPPARADRPVAFVCSLFDTGLAAVRDLGRLGIPVVGLDPDPRQPGFRSRFGTPRLCPDPVHRPDELLQFLLDQGGGLRQPGVLIPASDAFVLFVSRFRDQLASAYRFVLPPAEVVEAIVDKRRQYALADRTGTPYPRTFYPTTLEEARQVAELVEFPAFLKPYHGHLWREVFGGTHKGFKVCSPAELVERFRSTLPTGLPLMVQSIIQGPNTNHFKVCAYISSAGQPLAVFTLRKIRQYPTEFGVGTLVESVHDPELAELGLRFLQAIGYRGIGSIEFKRDARDGQLKLIELNPRLWQQNAQATVCGLNFPLLAYLDALGLEPPAMTAFATGIKWLDATADMQAFWEYFRRGELSILDWLRSLRGAGAFATFAADDPGPFLQANDYGAKYLRLPLYLLRHAR
jgi:predicted ATP-grasp superfamily ATP-dependent carboligase